MIRFRQFRAAQALLALSAAIAPTGLFAQQQTSFTRDSSTGAYAFSFEGVSGRTYFFQYSEDLLQPWHYLPVIEVGLDAPISYGLMFSDPQPRRIFLRLRYTDQSYTGDPYAADFDGDGLSNGWELANGLDPFTDDASGDADGDGISNLVEYQIGTSPLFRDSNPLGLEVCTP